MSLCPDVDLSKQSTRNIVRIPLSSVRVDEKNPRKTFEAIEEFAESIEEGKDFEVPIIVENLGKGNYFLIDGERRLRASKKAGLGYLWADVRETLSDLERGILRARLNFQHKNWSSDEQVSQINGLYDAWLDSKDEERPNEKAGRRKEFARVVGISEASLREYLSFGDSAIGTRFKTSPAMKALERGTATFESMRKIAHKDPVAQQAIIKRAEELRKEQPKDEREPVITKRTVVPAKAEYEVKTAPSKDEKNAEAYNDIRAAYRHMVGDAGTIRDRAKYLYKADNAREVLEMLDSMGKTIISIQSEVEKRFPSVKPRRV